MSFLLDALRKSEMERRVGEVPTLTSDVLAKAEQPKRHPFVLLIIVLILVNIGTLAYITLVSPNQSENPPQKPLAATTPVPPANSLEKTNPNPVSKIEETKETQTSPSPQIESSRPGPTIVQSKPMITSIEQRKDTNDKKLARQPTATKPAEIPRNRSADTVVKPPSAPRTEQVLTRRVPPKPVPVKEPPSFPEKSLQIGKVAKPLIKPETLRIEPAANPRPENLLPDPETPPEEIAPKTESDAIPFLNGMPRDFQREVPSLNINVFVYSEDPSERFVIVNMSKYRSGEKIDNGPEIQEIRADSLVLNYLGRKFRVKRP